ncbi:MAG: DUF4397 domain-containing protein [Crocinitomicaceae bacterium]
MKEKFNTLKNYILAVGLFSATGIFAQDARVQIIHNSADAATEVVDIYAGATLLVDDFEFRTATSFIDVAPGALQVGIAAGNSMSADDTLIAFDLTLMSNETYVVIANGILSGSGYSPAPPITLDVMVMGQETANSTGNTDVLVFHGSTDAPTVDVSTPGGAMMPLVNNAEYGDFTSYLELPTADYTLNVTDETGSVVVASFQAPLATLGLDDAAAVVVASGFLDPSNNSNGEAFGLWVALPSGGDMVELPSSQARLQVIHNSADAAAATVDVYFNGDLLIDDFAFRTASAYIDVPAEVENEISIAPGNSTDVGDAIVDIPTTFSANETYVAIANGIISMSGYTPATSFSLDVFDMGQETSNVSGNTDVLVFHGSTDAPTVDVSAVGAGTIVDDAMYGDFAGYLELANADYILEVQDMTGATTLFSYSAPLATLSLADLGIVVVASGFVDPAVNSNGAGFGLWVALPAGGAMVELPTAFASIDQNELQLNVFPNPTADYIRVEGINETTFVQIMDMTGRIVLNSEVQNNEEINVSSLNTGNYIVSFSNLKGTSNLPLMIRK